MRGWRSYFGFCETPEVLIGLTRWVRLRLRAAMWPGIAGNGQFCGKAVSLRYRNITVCLPRNVSLSILKPPFSCSPPGSALLVNWRSTAPVCESSSRAAPCFGCYWQNQM
jgi:Group II intron, maturase-specific domain